MTTIIKLLKQLTHVKGLFSLGVICLMVATLMGQLSPLLLQDIIDQILTPVSKGQPLNHSLFLTKAAFYTSLLLLSSLLFYLDRRLLAHCANKVTAHLREAAFDQLQGLPMAYFDDKPAGKIATRIVNDTETLRHQFYNDLLTQIGINLVKIIAIYLVLIRLNPMIGLGLLSLIPIFYGLQVFYKGKTNQPFKTFYEARGEVNNQVNEVMNGASILQLYQQEDKILTDFEQLLDEMTVADETIVHVGAYASWSLTEFFKYNVIAGILTLFGLFFLRGNQAITAGQLFIYLNYLTTLFDLLGGLVRQFPAIQRSLETGRRVLALLEEPIETDSSHAITINQGAVRLEHIHFAYAADKPVLTDINLTIKPGKTVALVGHTGSGKSSLINLLYRFYSPTAGRILIDQQDISQFSRESLRSQMGIVLQDPYLFTGTLASNIRMDNPTITDERIENSLIKIGAGDLLNRLEQGIHSPVTDKGTSFSSGERQLIAFARTLAADPKILILDEATSHIDTETEALIQQAMAVVKEGRTTIIIAHRLSTIQDADQILVLDQGRIIESGNHAELLAQNGRYADMYRTQENLAGTMI